MLDEGDVPVLMDFGSMGPARHEIDSPSQALKLQVKLCGEIKYLRAHIKLESESVLKHGLMRINQSKHVRKRVRKHVRKHSYQNTFIF